jgi:CHASE1-domain containing sensor protein
MTLTAVTLLMGASISMVARWDDERLRANFEREAVSTSSALAFQLQEPLHALEALRGVYLASDDVSAAELRRAARSWLDSSSRIQAMGYVERVRREDVPAFERQVRAAGVTGYHVVDRHPARRRGAAGRRLRDPPRRAARAQRGRAGRQCALGSRA